ncbi:MAG: Type III restriction-modification system StyLTI enzyme mod [Parcubacteria group bacterium GW2011_GWA2_38_27]|nr:MAG: Type III restriction-modification system StyLTI enzyme mod [Parcubacteria group bacterium GW2011_GWA2_38_27]
MANNHKYDKYTREELVDELETLKKKKYGLVWDKKNSQEVLDAFVNWENVPENFAPKQFPVLKEIKNKEIETDKDKPVNLLIEGDNYHSLAVLNFTHQNKIDVIYIDPPYNTGKEDFIFNDKFVDFEDPYRHSKWLSFMDKRLRLAKNLLKETGVIFISIDDNEVSQLKLLCDEIFSEKNFVQNFMWLHGKGKKDRWSRTLQQYILCYAKNKNKLPSWSILSYANYKFENPDNDKRGGWFSGSVSFSEERSNKQHPNYFEIKSPSGIVWKRQWQRSKDEMEDLLKEKKIFFGLPPKYDAVPRIKIFPDDIDEQIPPNIIDGVESTREAQKKLDEMFGKKVFDYPKPVSLMKRLIKISSKDDALILDYMAGSGTTGHAVLEINKEESGNRKFILCTNNENNIATNVCYPRIEKVINGYKDSKGKDFKGFGGNLKYFKTDFVGSDSTDKNKRDLVNKSAEMICIKEDIFDLVADKGFDYKIYQKGKKFLGVIFDNDSIAEFKKEAEKHKGNFVVYCFSYTEATPEKEFKGLKNKYVLKPIPAIILKIYIEIFKK